MDTTEKASATKNTQSLSGGERSFTTVCFIMSLWNAMEAPFRILDEFDVFMVGAGPQSLSCHCPCVPPPPCLLLLLLSFLAAGHAEPTDSDDFNAQVCGRGVQTTVHLPHSSGYAVRLLVQVMSIQLTLSLSP